MILRVVLLLTPPFLISVQGHHFRITTLHSPPFITEFGVDSMDGMFAEVFKALQECQFLAQIFTHSSYLLSFILQDIMNFTFSVVTPEDKAYGAYEEKTGQWSGMVGQLARREVDIGSEDVCECTQVGSVHVSLLP